MMQQMAAQSWVAITTVKAALRRSMTAYDSLRLVKKNLYNFKIHRYMLFKLFFCLNIGIKI